MRSSITLILTVVVVLIFGSTLYFLWDTSQNARFKAKQAAGLQSSVGLPLPAPAQARPQQAQQSEPQTGKQPAQDAVGVPLQIP